MRDIYENQKNEKKLRGWRGWLLVAAVTGVPVAVTLAAIPNGRGSPAASLVAGTVAGALLLTATLMHYLHWLIAPAPRSGWTAAAMFVLSVQVLAGSALGLTHPYVWTGLLRWVSISDLLATAVAVGFVLIGTRGVPAPDPLLLGMSLGFALTGLEVVEYFGPPLAELSVTAAFAGLAVILVGHLWVAAVVLLHRGTGDRDRLRLASTVVLIGAAHLARSGIADSWGADLAAVMALVAAASLWTGATFTVLRQALADQRDRSRALEGSLLEIETSWRGSREQLHEIRSTLAGAARASMLLEDHTLSVGTHAKLERAVRAELHRLERLLGSRPATAPEAVDLDATVDVLLETHRARGRTISWEPTGASVLARADDVTEALNILLDNAATHGGSASTIAVTCEDDLVHICVSDLGPGVPADAKERIFDWGVHGSESPGQGIGLNVARRLVAEHGGSLTLAEAQAPGSSFVIRLPIARRSEENHVHDLGTSA